jgi:membrane dipeptidase
MWIFDAHLDLAMNAIEWNRDLTRPIETIRQHEAHLRDKPDRGRGTVCLPELRDGRIRLVVATLIARVEHDAYSPVPGWASPEQAWAMTQAQRAWYRAMEEAGEMVLISGQSGLTSFVHGTPASEPGIEHDPVGFILSLEGADSLRTPGHLERAWADGLRVVGPAHYGPGRYAQGTNTAGGFNAHGRELLKEMERLGMILDITHLSDDCFREALDRYHGPVWASHHNARALVPHQRQLSDEMIRALIQRDAVIGIALDAWMLVPGWVRGVSTPESTGVNLERVVDHIDHVCQLAGDCLHVGIGSDLDGAFGTEQTPRDLQSVADLARIPGLLLQRGYSELDAANIAHGNFVRFLQRAWQ